MNGSARGSRVGLALAALLVLDVHVVGIQQAAAQQHAGGAREAAARDAAERRGRASYESAKRSQTPFYTPPVLRSANGVLSAELIVNYRATVFNGMAVELRSYSDRLHGPTLMIKPGDALRVRLRNELPAAGPGDASHLNTTNLHTHGLQVSPEDNSDNVFLAIHPGGVFDFEFKVPSWHAPGTHWYHGHSHGSTAVQVSSGMAGALLIEGGLDAIPEIQQARDLLFLLQQIPYDVEGKVESIEQVQAWGGLGRETTINGQLQPVLAMAPGEVQRWRLIHAGVAEKLELEIREVRDDQTTALLSLFEIAADGIPLGWKRETKQLDLGPGYRSDVLVQAPATPGKYYLVDKRSPAQRNFRKGSPKGDRFLMQIDVQGAPATMALPADAALASAPKPAPIASLPAANVRSFVFAAGDETGSGKINAKSFSPTRTDVAVNVDTVEEWRLSTDQNPPVNGPHPFHVHVNPFFVEMADPVTGVGYSTWKDTLLVGDAPITVKTRFAKEFPGKTVFHCHRLDHEDHGMMGVLRINDVVEAGGNLRSERPPPNGRAPLIAPEWKLVDLNGEHWTHESFRGRPLLLVLYRGLGCLHCVEQIALLRKNLAAFEEREFRVVLVSSDDRASLIESRKSYRQPLPFLLLADPERKLFGALGCVDPQRQAALHGVFVIDGKGAVRWSHRSEEALLDMQLLRTACAFADSQQSTDFSDDRQEPR